MIKIKFFKNCGIEIYKSLLYDQINSKKHKDFKNCFIMKCMTYCDICGKQIENDEWREQRISEKHLELEEKNYCRICNLKYDIQYNALSCYQIKSTNINDRGSRHRYSGTHLQSQERLGFYSG